MTTQYPFLNSLSAKIYSNDYIKNGFKRGVKRFFMYFEEKSTLYYTNFYLWSVSKQIICQNILITFYFAFGWLIQLIFIQG